MKKCILVLIILVLYFPGLWAQKNSHQQDTWIPIFGSTSTYGFFAGASYMSYPKTKYGYFFSARLMATMQPYWNGGISFDKWTAKGFNYRTHFNYSGWFDPYYGEGSETKSENRVDILYHYTIFKQEMLKKINKKMAVGGFVEARYREERGSIDNEDLRVFPLEATPVYGLLAEYDTRNDRFSPTKGLYHQMRLRYYPGSGSNLEALNSFHQIEGDFRYYKSFMKNKVWAIRGALASSGREPSYVYRYSLGGPRALRGYQKNRFRGKKYYALQNEVRTPIKKYLSGVVYVDAGDITDDEFKTLLWTYGVGLRFGLPPDYQMKIRLDMGWSEDQSSVSILFGQAF